MLRIERGAEYFIDFCDDKCVALVKTEVRSGAGKRSGKAGVSSKAEKAPKEVQRVLGYYGNLKDALKGYLKAVEKEPSGSLKEIMQHIKRAEEAISEISEMTEKDFKKAMKAEKEKKKCKGKADS